MSNETRGFTRLLAILPLILGSVPGASAQTIHYVDNLGDCDAQLPCYTRVVDAVSAAAAGDIIEVFPGVYREAVVFQGSDKQDIVLRGHHGTQKPVIAAPAGARPVTLITPGIHVLGFVLESSDGVGLQTFGAAGSSGALIGGNVIKSPGGISIINCIGATLRDNVVLGGGINVRQSCVSCRFERNAVHGGGLGLGQADFAGVDNAVRGNVVTGGGISFPGVRPMTGNVVEDNTVDGGGIGLTAVQGARDNVISHNLVRGGGISMGMIRFGEPFGPNAIEANFVSGSQGDGIALRNSFGGVVEVKRNTAVESGSGCDLNDTARPDAPAFNLWKNNRFGTRCGAATE